MTELSPKFIIETNDELGDCLIIGKCNFHKNLVTDKTKVKGGGWWDLKDNMFIFSRESHDYGKARFEEIKNCIEKGNVFTDKYLRHSIANKYSFAYHSGSEIIRIKDKFGVIMTCLPKYSNCQLCKYKDEPQDSEVCIHCVKNNKRTEYYT